MAEGVRVNRAVTIPEDELELRFSPSGGPGGQHANRSATRVDLAWNVDDSKVLGTRQRELIRRHLRHRIDSAGNLRLSSDAHRSQLRNREEVTRRLAQLVTEALKPRRARVPTKATAPSRERRLTDKRRRAELKRQRKATLEE